MGSLKSDNVFLLSSAVNPRFKQIIYTADDSVKEYVKEDLVMRVY